MSDRRPVRLLSVVLLVVLCASPAHAAKKQSTSTPAPAPAPKTPAPATPAPAARPDSSAPAAATPSVATTPGPLVAPGSPVAGRTTIAPFPVPGDTSRAARERAKAMNVPRSGLTLTGPIPQLDGPDRTEWFERHPGSFVIPQAVDVFPEQLRAPAPGYPKAARDAGIEGIVMVMAHVGTDGRVGETRVVKSIPMLDSVAVQAVKRMGFRPASIQGKPVAVWVGVPVRFTLH